MRFVVHEHQASHHHYDFRLELDDALKSWAMPKGPSMNPEERHLAVRTPDHPLSYGDFEGIIPEGQYGAGPVVIWDRGRFVPESDDALRDLAQGELSFALHGKKLRGLFTLIQLKRGDGRHWLLIKNKDEFASKKWRIKSALTAERLNALRPKEPPCETH